MALGSDLRIIIDGDSSRLFREGEQVKGRVILVAGAQEAVEALTVSFIGRCTTKTTRPLYTPGNAVNADQSRREFVEQIQLFSFAQDLAAGSTLAARKHVWDFDFRFPDHTEPQYSRLVHGSKYFKDPHLLPPSFKLNTDHPGGKAKVSYFIQAKLVRQGSKEIDKVTQTLAYQPTTQPLELEPKVISRILYAQTWKPVKDTRSAIDKVFTKVTRRTPIAMNAPRIVPTIHYSEKVAPGQSIPLLLSLTNTGHPSMHDEQCILDSITVTISTYTTSMCGQSMTQPEDVVSKHVTCISKSNMNRPVPFSTPTVLTTDFRLVDDAECVPSFITYTITRRYSMTVTIGLKYEEHKSTIRATTSLEILPRMPREFLGRALDVQETDDDQLPLYMPREPSKEFAPDYETLYALSPSSLGGEGLPRCASETNYDRAVALSPATSSSTPRPELNSPMLENMEMQVREEPRC
ncbi:hypothetical protein BDV95DRAFT_497579 [Massariosphaeria phaeospora]|uniref:Arrestin-like N-terminal domain-containing protein n=1 Tax=Massariosphaeria phaeospora TaxID=100035 RepID=A0A7C8M464_9PLEO|nr:hypothetical protein BDV95DRAFT_497579 [Massariosphaeria phaeospora]